jgi:hypothetical protein
MKICCHYYNVTTFIYNCHFEFSIYHLLNFDYESLHNEKLLEIALKSK